MRKKKFSFTRIAAYVGLLTILLDVVLIVGMGIITPKYNPLRQYISELGSNINPNAWLINFWWSIYSFLMLTFTYGLYLIIKKNKYGWLGPLLLCLDFIGNGLLSGIFKCDIGCHGSSFSNISHYIFSAIGTIAATFAPLGLYFGIHKDPRWKLFKRRLISLAMILIVSFLIMSYFELFVLFSYSFAFSGMTQRIHTVIYYWFLLQISGQMLKISKKIKPY